MFTNYELTIRILPLYKMDKSINSTLSRGEHQHMIEEEFLRICEFYGVEFTINSITKRDNMWAIYDINISINSKDYSRVVLRHRESIFSIIKTAFSSETKHSIYMIPEIEYKEINS